MRNLSSKRHLRDIFLNDLEDFDATFFGITPREAEQMDPQQRIAVEVVWEALKNSGIPPQNLAGSDTAVFIGVNSDDYFRLLLEDLPNVEAWMGVGTAFCGIPNRISYLLDLMGPGLTRVLDDVGALSANGSCRSFVFLLWGSERTCSRFCIWERGAFCLARSRFFFLPACKYLLIE